MGGGSHLVIQPGGGLPLLRREEDLCRSVSKLRGLRRLGTLIEGGLRRLLLDILLWQWVSELETE